MHKFEIVEIHCNSVSTQGTTQGGRDDLLLEIRPDNGLREPYSPHLTLRGGESWDPIIRRDVIEAYPFASSVDFALHTWPPVGEVSKTVSEPKRFQIGSDPQSGQIELREKDGGPARYTIDYAVVRDAFSNPDVSTVDHAIDKLKNSAVRGPWSQLDDRLAKEWIEHLAKRPIDNRPLPEEHDQQNPNEKDPFEVQQAQIGYCGNAAVEFSLAYTRPRRFVEACRAIYETGAMVGNYHVLRMTEDLRHSPSPTQEYLRSSWLAKICKKKYTIPEGDWLFMAFIEDMEDFWKWKSEEKSAVPETVPEGAIKGVTYENWQDASNVPDHEFWTWEVIGLTPETVISHGSTTGVDCLRRAAQAVRNGGVALLAIDVQLIKVKQPANVSPPFVHDHAVSLYRDESGTVLDESGGTFSFKVHSWGESYAVDSFPSERINQLLRYVTVGE